MKKPEPAFSTDGLLSEIQAKLATSDEGVTTREVCVAMGLLPFNRNIAKVGRIINDMVVGGLAERCEASKVTVGMDNVGRPASAWRLVEPSDDSS